MLKKLHLFILIIFLSESNAQQILPLDEKPYLDSLNNVINRTHNNSIEKANAYLAFSDYWRNKDSIKSKNFIKSAEKYVGNNAILIGKKAFYEGQYYFNTNPHKASSYFQKCIQIFNKIKTAESYSFQAAAWYNYALMNREKGYPFIIKILLEKSIPLSEKSGKAEKTGHFYGQLGTVFMNNSQFDKAEIYNKKAVDILEKKASKSSSLFFAYLSSVSNYTYQQKLSEAKISLDKAYAIISNMPPSTNHSLYYYNASLYYITVGDLINAEKNIQKGLPIAYANHQADLSEMLKYNLYEILKGQKKYNDAKNLLLEIVQNKRLTAEVNNRKELYGELSKIHESSGNINGAYEWLKKYTVLTDSINKENLKLEINKLDNKFKNSEREKQLAKSQLEINTKNKYIWIISLLSLLFIMFGTIILIYYRSARKLSEARAVNLQQQLKEQTQLGQLKVTKAMLDGEEKERERIAKDLHDGLGGMLAGVKINLSSWSHKTSNISSNQGFGKIINQLDSSLNELRRIARNMMPESLLNFGLETAIKELCEFYMTESLEIDYETLNLNNNIPLNSQINIFRIIQELLNNAIKHSGADKIFLQCSQDSDYFFITIEDNGKGIDLEKDHDGMGLKNIRNRVDYMKGKIEISSEPNIGTFINIELNTHADQ